jgi:hypothetical protein
VFLFSILVLEQSLPLCVCLCTSCSYMG